MKSQFPSLFITVNEMDSIKLLYNIQETVDVIRRENCKLVFVLWIIDSIDCTTVSR